MRYEKKNNIEIKKPGERQKLNLSDSKIFVSQNDDSII